MDRLEQTKAERSKILSAKAEELSALFYQLDETLSAEQVLAKDIPFYNFLVAIGRHLHLYS